MVHYLFILAGTRLIWDISIGSGPINGLGPVRAAVLAEWRWHPHTVAD